MSTLSASPIPSHMTSASNTTPSSSRTRPSPHGSPQQQHSHGSPKSSSSRDGSVTGADVEAILRSHGGDPRKAVEALLNDRSSLQSQNGQLWKLIEKQRAQCASLAADNERLRSDREKANAKLASAGMDTIGGKRIPSSSSAIGLGLRPEPPQIKRHNSDQDRRMEKIEAPPRPSLTVPSPQPSSQGSPAEKASPTDKVYTSPLLPSPTNIQESKLRPQSRMVFPSEVTSWLSLADSPKQMQKREAKSTPPSALASTIGDPSNPSQSSANDLDAHAAANSSFSSSRMLAFNGQPVLEEDESIVESDQPGQIVPPRGSSMQSPDLSAQTTAMTQEPLPLTQSPETQSAQRPMEMPQPRPLPSDTPHRPSVDSSSQASLDVHTVEEAARPPPRMPSPSRALPKITPNLLPHTRLSIPNSTVFPNASGRDVLCFIVSITMRLPNSQPISWNVAKLFSAFIDLDTKIRARSGKSRKEWKSITAPLPDAKAWKDFAPSKIDQRKKALEAYIQSLLVAPLSDKTDLCDFLCTDPVQSQSNAARKEGYLTKKGKNFGGWKTRYFVLAGPVMEYYETRGGAHLGSIVITNAQIGRQNRPTESSDERDFRHAFLIIEQSKRGAANRHVLCAESDADRDAWIELLVRFVDPEANTAQMAPLPPPPAPSSGQGGASGLSRRRSNSRKNSKDVVITNAAPMGGLSNGSKFGGAPSPSLFNAMEQKKSDQGPTPNGSHQQHQSQHNGPHLTVSHSSSVDMLSTSPSGSSGGDLPTSRSAKRQSMMPNRPPQSSSSNFLSKVASEGLQAPPGRDRDRKAKSGRFWPSFGKHAEKVFNPVFGVPLSDSVAIASKANLPAIVYRCIEYLEAKKAETEEGIYRLSGSSAVIKGLKDRFDSEGDVHLLQVDEFWDPHAIAGLLKTFLRELPTSLLTMDLHPRFLAVMDLIDSSARVAELSRLVSELPPPNYALLRALTAHLILIVQNSAVNKMTLRNIGIVFSPTLGVPAGIFSEMVTHFGAIFDDDDPPESTTDQSHPPADDHLAEETITRKRNSMLYQAGGADALLGLGGRALDPSAEDSASEVSTEEVDGEAESEIATRSDDDMSAAGETPKAEAYPSPPAIRRPKASERAADRGLAVETGLTSDSIESRRSPTMPTMGLPISPRPPGSAGMDSFRSSSPRIEVANGAA